MKVVGIIPARWGSTRFPGKALVDIAGKPLVCRVLERAQLATKLDDVVVATDDERIVEAVKAHGGAAVMTRSDHPSGSDRIAEAAEKLGADIVINIQGDEPLIDPELIDALADVMIEEPTWDMATAASPIESDEDVQDPGIVKVVWGAEQRALYFSRAPIPYDRDSSGEVGDVLYWRHIGIYAYQFAFLKRMVSEPQCLLERVEKLEQLRALHIGARMKVLQTRDAGPGVDTPKDVARAEAALLAARIS